MQRRIFSLATGSAMGLGLAVLSACSGGSDDGGSPPPTSFTVSGVVASGAPLVGAVVTLTDTARAWRHRRWRPITQESIRWSRAGRRRSC